LSTQRVFIIVIDWLLMFRETEPCEMNAQVWSIEQTCSGQFAVTVKLKLMYCNDMNVATQIRLRGLERAGQMCRMERSRTLRKS